MEKKGKLLNVSYPIITQITFKGPQDKKKQEVMIQFTPQQ